MAILHEAVSPESLERHLHERDSILVVELVQKELVQLQQLVPFDILDLLLATHVRKLRDGLREFQIDKGMDTVQDTFRVDVLGLVGAGGSFWIGAFRCFHF